MVDPATSDPDRPIPSRPGALRGVATRLALVGLGGCLAGLLALLVGLLALPWVAGGLFFYNAVRTTPAAHAYQQAPPCAADASSGNCVRLVHGTVTAVDTRTARPGFTTSFSVQLANGIQTGRMTTLVGPPWWLETGQAVDVTIYEGRVAQIGFKGLQADTDDNPVVHSHDFLISGSMCLAFGLVLDGGIVIAMRRRRQGSDWTPG